MTRTKAVPLLRESEVCFGIVAPTTSARGNRVGGSSPERALGRPRLLFHNNNMGEIRIELEREEDGRWIAEITAVPGVMAYGQTANDALQEVSKLLCQVLDERVSAGEITEQEAAEALKGLAA